MNKNNLNTMFKNIKEDFNFEEPNAGHQKRFLDKLNNQNTIVEYKSSSVRRLWRPLIGVAASIVLLISVFLGIQKDSNTRDLANISPEMASTEDFFLITITSELEKLNSEDSPEYQELIVDALFQIKILEENYKLLKLDLNESGDDKRVIYAMISNFQNRIDLLQNVVEQIDNLKQQKIEQDENSSTL
ncbi:FIG00649226: hypothetical protein [hydrothermal vent metagenome]|uniref:Anti-sigma factor n=1 Tax=hydrothermal vent metagenome TaxID=652676 RepID=A0A3B0QP88_9ZZZZ